MASIPGSPLSHAPRLSALAVSFVLTVGLVGAIAPGVLATSTQSAQTIGANSCIGQHACFGATGNIGRNSCNGDYACANTSADIARNSCNGTHACSFFKGSIGRHACVGTDACRDGSGSIGAHSCNFLWACMYSMGDIGANSCNDLQACREHGNHTVAVPIGDGSCNGNGACWGTTAPIGDDSCVGFAACYYLTVAVGDHSCIGDEACAHLTTAVGDCANNVPGWVPKVCLEGGYLPDGRIRKGSGAFVGNDIYDPVGYRPTGYRQAKIVTALPGQTLTFGISVQNDSAVYADSFTILATGTTNDGFSVAFFKGTTNITDAVAAGTFATPILAPGAKYLITAKVMLKRTTRVSSGAWRLVMITSTGDATRQDAVVFIVTCAP
ncbi:MAG: hypothetical protein ABI725_06490 [Chloroflexota bacterium]